MANTSSLQAERRQRKFKLQFLKRREKRAEASKQRHERADALKNAGNQLFKEQDYAGAADLYMQAVQVKGPHPVLMSNLAAAYLKLECYDLAEWAAGQALMYDPSMTKARYRRAMARKGMNHLKAAMIDLEKIIEDDDTAATQAYKELYDIQDSYEAEEDSDDGYSSEEYAWPTNDDEPLDYQSDSDSSDCQHTGNDIPCRFYNHEGCSRGDRCAYSHAPDKKSVRDELGKNVCLFFLIGNCNFGETRCIYSHSKAYLTERGWRNDPEQVEAAREMAALFELESKDHRAMDKFFREHLTRHSVAGNFRRRQFDEHLQNHGAPSTTASQGSGRATQLSGATSGLVGTCSHSSGASAHLSGSDTRKAEKHVDSAPQQTSRIMAPKVNLNTKTTPPSNSIVLLLSLEDPELFTSIHQHFLTALATKVKVISATSKDQALRMFDSSDLVGVFVTDPGIMQRKNRAVAAKLVEFVKNGGYAVIGGIFSTFVSMQEMEIFFLRTWGLPWKRGSYHRTTFSVNPDNEIAKINPSLASSYSMKALHIDGISPEMAVYKPTEDSHLQSMVFAPAQITDLSESPAVSARVGRGHLSYLGDVNAEEASTKTVLAMLGLLDTPSNAQDTSSAVREGSSAPRQDTPGNGAATDKGKAKVGDTAVGGATSDQGASASNDAQSPPHFLLLLALQDNLKYITSRAQEFAALRAKIDVVSAVTAEQALPLLSPPNLAGVFIAASGVTEARNAQLLARLVQYVNDGGVLAVGGLTLSKPKTLESFFSSFGLDWKIGSNRTTMFSLEKYHETAKKNPSLPQSISMRGLHLKNIPSDVALYFVDEEDSDDEFDLEYGKFFVAPWRTDFESAMVRTRVEKGYVGFVGDVEGVAQSTDVLLALLNLLDPIPTRPKPTSRKFVIVLSFERSNEIEVECERLFTTLRTKLEVLHGLSNERVIDLLGSTDLAGILIVNAEIMDIQNTYLLSQLVEYSHGGETVVFGGHFSKHLVSIEVKQFFRDSWDLLWELGSSTSVSVAANRDHQLVKSYPSLPASMQIKATHLMGMAPATAVYSAKNVRHPSRPRETAFQSPFVHAPAGQGHLGYLGTTGLDKEEQQILFAMLGLV